MIIRFPINAEKKTLIILPKSATNPPSKIAATTLSLFIDIFNKPANVGTTKAPEKKESAKRSD